jgi:hypothetical protein
MADDKRVRTATEVLLSLESKVDLMMQMLRGTDLNLRVISNKLGLLLEHPGHQNIEVNNPYTIAIAPPSLQSDFKMKVADQLEEVFPKDAPLSTDVAPVGFRRTSRPETYTSSASATQGKNVPTPSLPQPEMRSAKIEHSRVQHEPSMETRVPISQRVCDKGGKSIFLASVDIIDLATQATAAKTRTNGVGKYQASLPPGDYKVVIKPPKGAEMVQHLTIDHNTPSDLPIVMAK